MNAPEPRISDETPVSLEAVELELSLGVLDLASLGFENCVSQAAEANGGTLLFHMPVEFIPGCQRIAAVLAGRGFDRRTVLVMLDEKGDSMRVEDAGHGNAFSGLAASYAKLVTSASTD